MGDVQYKPGHYWDHRECAWVRCPTPEPVVPEQAEPVDDQMLTAEEADVRSG